MTNIGFIGVGYMGYGIAKNILKNNHSFMLLLTGIESLLIKLLVMELKK